MYSKGYDAISFNILDGGIGVGSVVKIRPNELWQNWLSCLLWPLPDIKCFWPSIQSFDRGYCGGRAILGPVLSQRGSPTIYVTAVETAFLGASTSRSFFMTRFIVFSTFVANARDFPASFVTIETSCKLYRSWKSMWLFSNNNSFYCSRVTIA